MTVKIALTTCDCVERVSAHHLGEQLASSRRVSRPESSRSTRVAPRRPRSCRLTVRLSAGRRARRRRIEDRVGYRVAFLGADPRSERSRSSSSRSSMLRGECEPIRAKTASGLHAEQVAQRDRLARRRRGPDLDRWPVCARWCTRSRRARSPCWRAARPRAADRRCSRLCVRTARSAAVRSSATCSLEVLLVRLEPLVELEVECRSRAECATHACSRRTRSAGRGACIGSRSAAFTSFSCSASVCTPLRAMNSRRISFAPSKMRLMRAVAQIASRTDTASRSRVRLRPEPSRRRSARPARSRTPSRSRPRATSRSRRASRDRRARRASRRRRRSRTRCPESLRWVISKSASGLPNCSRADA